MKIVQLRGGLGNQMFQYAFALALKYKWQNEEVLIDTQLYRLPFVKSFRGNNFYHNGYEIDTIFPNAKIPIASWLQLIKVSYYVPNYLLNRAVRKLLPMRRSEFVQPSKKAYLYDPQALETLEASYFEGYWFSPFYFDFCKPRIIDVYSFKPFETDENKFWAEKLCKDNSVTIHVRRGDFLNIPIFKDICNLDYYQKAIDYSKKYIESPKFYIFSNDQEWCKVNLKHILGDSPVEFVTNNRGLNSYRDMHLMSLARCNILANSSFSWWGAYLNQRDDQIVLAPTKWVNIPCEDALCQNWIRI